MDSRAQAAAGEAKSKPADRGGSAPRATAAGAPAATSGRVASIDALRGFDMFWIVGGGGVVMAVVVAIGAVIPSAWLEAAAPYFPSAEWFESQMRHVAWEGFSAWDLIMPLFLFIVGAAMPFSFAKRIERGQSKWALHRKVFRRVIILWILGMIAQGNLLDFDLSRLHLFSNTLQAIAVGYLVAALALIHLSIGLQAVLCAALLIGFWLLMLLVPVPEHGAGVFDQQANLAMYIDEAVLRGFRDGTTYTWILSGMGFAGTVMLGVFSGHILRTAWSQWTKVAVLAAFGGLLLALGWFWSGGFDGVGGVTIVGGWRCPMIKHLFTSSMVLWACGWSYLLLALFYLVIDVLGFRRWSFLFVVIGANAIFAYMLVHPFHLDNVGSRFVGGLAKYINSLPPPGPAIAGAIVPVAGFVVLWLVLYYMYRKGTLIRV